ncbi:MAG: isoleucine--tRNA ligase [Gammaproteobacteria bacterium]
MDYKQTLNLPETGFAMKANLSQREPERLKGWQENKLYEAIRQARAGAPKYILHDGPPYANGAIHLGHATNKILKDFILKAKTLSGFDCPYIPGWDCHGLPIEINVEKKVGRVGDKINATEFRKACRDYAMTQVEAQRKEFIRLGVLGDWGHPYLTMDHEFEANVVRSLAKIIANGHLVQGFKPVHWCLDCKSALAEAEVEYQDKTSSSVHVTFPVVDHLALNSKVPRLAQTRFTAVSLVIWTTTPWTLPSNKAVCLHPDIEYAFVAVNRGNGPECLVLASTRVEACMATYGITEFEVIAMVPGSQLENIALQHPWIETSVPVILGDHVTTETGTGCVHTAPDHGEDDYRVAMAYHLTMDHRVDARGLFTGNTPVVAGMHVFKSNDTIIQTLAEHGRLLAQDKVQHSYPHCWRHRTPIIFRATPQWFISMEQEGLRRNALKAIRNVKFVPEWGEARITKMVENAPDWCVSRQRTWTMPITSYMHRDTGELHPNTQEIMEKVALEIEKHGMEAWYNYPDADLIGDDVSSYHKIPDGLDVWFDSGVTHACVLDVRKELHSPADLYLEGSDQHRGWFNSSLMTRVAMFNEAPYKQVLTHGFLLDGTGRKMSKSLGNDVAPDKVISQFGADILRLWVAGSDYRNDMTYSDEIVNRTVDAYRRIRNTSRFLLANLNGFDPQRDLLPASKCTALDRYMIRRAIALQDELRAHYDAFEFHQVYQKLHHACSIDLGSFYLDIIKDRQYTAKSDGAARRSAQTALYHWVQALTRWMAPVLSFTADEIWEQIPGYNGESLFTQTWYDQFPTDVTDAVFTDEYWKAIMAVRDEVNKHLEALRKAGDIGSGLDTHVVLHAKDKTLEQLQALKTELRFVLITSDASVVPMSRESNTALPDLAVEINVTNAVKCVRCWQRREDVGSVEAHPELCSRCVENVDGAGEVRFYA